MSIFLDVIRELVVKSLEAIKVRIEKDDNSFSSAFRNKEISEFKKKLASEMIKFSQAQPDDVTDEKIKDNIVAKLLDIQKDAHLQCQEYGVSDGQFGSEINNLILMVQTLHSKLDSFKVLDVHLSTDPFVQLCFFSSQYLSHKIYQSLTGSMVSYISRHPNVLSVPMELTKEKERLLKSTIENCKFELDGLDKANANYKQHYQARVLEALDKIKKENEGACDKYRSSLGMPLVSFKFFTAISASFSLGPQLGYLDVYMQRAKEVIEKNGLDFEPHELVMVVKAKLQPEEPPMAGVPVGM